MWAIVPLKSPEAAKSRLAAVLAPAQRRALYFSLADQVITTLSTTRGIDRVAVVTASDEVETFARALGAEVIRQPADSGTAEAFAAAVEHLRPLRFEKLLMIAGDLPLISAEAVEQMLLAARNTPGIVIAPDRQRIGTNALLCTPPDVIAPCFGVDSFQRHLAAAEASSLPVEIFECEALALDIDVVADLEQLPSEFRVWRDHLAFRVTSQHPEGGMLAPCSDIPMGRL